MVNTEPINSEPVHPVLGSSGPKRYAPGTARQLCPSKWAKSVQILSVAPEPTVKSPTAQTSSGASTWILLIAQCAGNPVWGSSAVVGMAGTIAVVGMAGTVAVTLAPTPV